MKTPGFWRDTTLLSGVLMPLSWLYRFGAWLDRTITMPEQAPIPVLSIGNVTAGGAGKTPTALALAPMLEALGAITHVISRGYGGARHTAHRITPTDSWQEVGDEALLLARIGPTWIGGDRIASIRAAAAEGATLAICDDAHQHHKLRKTVSLLVIDGPYGIGNGQLMPAGPLREPFAVALRRSDAVVIIGTDRQQLAAQISVPVFHAEFKPTIDTHALQNDQWLAFAGTGRPEKFFESLAALNLSLAATRAFPDHHPYTAADLDDLRSQANALGARLITTEKDAVKIPAEALRDIQLLPVTLTFADPEALRQFLRQKLA